MRGALELLIENEINVAELDMIKAFGKYFKEDPDVSVRTGVA